MAEHSFGGGPGRRLTSGTPLAQFQALLTEPAPDEGSADELPVGVFLSVVVVSRGDLAALAELVLCLSAQTERDFEVLLVDAMTPTGSPDGLDELVADQPAWLQAALRRVDEHGSLAADLEAAVASARGSHLSIVEESCLLMGGWVEAFRDRAEHSPDRSLVSAAVTQRSEHLDVRGHGAVRATAAPVPVESRTAPLLRQLLGVPGPTAAWVVPLSGVREHPSPFTGSVAVEVEVRRLLAEVTERQGVDEFADVLVLERCLDSDAPLPAPADEWGAIDTRPWLLPAGALVHLRDLARRERTARARLEDAELRVDELSERLHRNKRKRDTLEQRLREQREQVRRLRKRLARPQQGAVSGRTAYRRWVPPQIVQVVRTVRRRGRDES